MKKLKYLFIHCSATPGGRDLTGEDIKRYHIEERGWSKPGYRLVIRLDGTIDRLIEVNDNAWVETDEITNGAYGYNSVSHHICYVGGTNHKLEAKDTRTERQKQALKDIVQWYLDHVPNIKILGHNEVANKACPSFDVQKWLDEEFWKE